MKRVFFILSLLLLSLVPDHAHAVWISPKLIFSLRPGLPYFWQEPLRKDPDNDPLPEGISIVPGRVGLRFDEFQPWGSLTASHEFRLYAPYDPQDFDPDWIGSAQSIFRVATDSGAPVQFSLRHTLTLNRYRMGGYLSPWGTLKASRTFDQRLRFAMDVKFSKHLDLFLPFFVRQARYGKFLPNARFNDSWRYAAWAAPELTYTFRDETFLSVSYETDTFVSGDLKTTYFADALASGSVMLWFGMPL